MASCDPDKNGEHYQMNNVGNQNHTAAQDSDATKQKQIKKKKKSKLRRVLSKYKIKKPRLVSKHGGLKVVATEVQSKQSMYASDLFTTMIDAKWHWIMLIFVTAYIGSWLLFGVVWYMLVYAYEPDYCVDNVNSFMTAFLFSLESQTTIGYGGRQITPKCAEAVILLNIQSLFGCFLNAFILGLIFSKLSRPRNRAGTIMFSSKALIAVRDGKMCLMFRVGDVRKSQILDCQVRVHLFRTRTTKEGLTIPFYQQDLKVGIDWNDEQSYGNTTVFLILPLTVVHVIDEESPLFTMTPTQLAESDFELVAILEGTIEATGLLTQAKTSYVGDEIMWGFEFRNTVDSSSWKGGRYRVDFSQFHNFVPVDTPRVSAMEFYEGKLYPPSHRTSIVTSNSSDDEGLSVDLEREEVAVQTDINCTDDTLRDWQIRNRRATYVKEERNGPLQFAENPGYYADYDDDDNVLFV